MSAQAVAQLRHLRERLRGGLVGAQGRALANGIDRWLAGEVDLDEAFGLSTGPGQRKAATLASIAARDDARVTGLPPAAKEKLVLLQEAKDAAFAVTRVTLENVRDANAHVRHWEHETAALRAAGRRGSAADHERANKALEEARAESQGAPEAAREGLARACSRPAAACREFRPGRDR